ncbi:MAG: carboxypeptidase regulatory-like domain-containing protein, partial [Proteobacteria bacterium]|nr:carboxypeptidase regulatory-like domain-containing protein [Pseudomonadota bacterium]
IQPGITVEVANGEIIFTARNEQGRPLAGARITLDGAASRVADSNGRVSFPAARGRHVLRIEAQGYPTSEAEVTV